MLHKLLRVSCVLTIMAGLTLLNLPVNALPGYHINDNASANRAVQQFAETPDKFAACVYQALLDKNEWRLTRAAYAYFKLKPSDPNRECSFSEAYWKSQEIGVKEDAPTLEPQTSLRMQTDADNAVQDAAKRLPDSYIAHMNYGDFIASHLLMDRSQIPHMMAEYKKAVALRPDLGDTHYHLALGYMDTGNFSAATADAAIAQFTQAVTLDPRLKDSYLYISGLYTWPAKHDYVTANKYMNKFLAVAPEEANRIDVIKDRADDLKHLHGG